jgi:hypothetical protein
MGFKQAVTIAQLLINYACKKAGILNDEADTYVDNILIVGKDEFDGMEKLKKLCSVLTSMGITIGDVTTGRVVEHRGMVMDFETKSVKLKQSFVEKIKQRLQSPTTWGDYRSLIGMVVHGLKFQRHTCTTFSSIGVVTSMCIQRNTCAFGYERRKIWNAYVTLYS